MCTKKVCINASVAGIGLKPLSDVLICRTFTVLGVWWAQPHLFSPITRGCPPLNAAKTLKDLIRQLQSVLNAAARLIYRLKSRDHITDALINLHRWRVPGATSTSWQFLRTRFYMEARHLTLVHSYVSLIYLVDERCVLQPSCCATSQTVHSRQSSLPGRRCPALEQLAWRHCAGWFAVNLSVLTETLSVPAVLPRCCTLTVSPTVLLWHS